MEGVRANPLDPLWIRHWSTFANSEDPDEMQHTAAFHQGLHRL